MEKASSLFNVSDYYVGLSQLYLLKATDIFNNNWTLSEHFETQKQENKKSIEGLVSKSEVTAKRATIIDPYNFIAWQNLALIYENTSFIINNNNEKALDALNRAIELSPNNYLAYIAKGRIYEELKEKELALEEYKKALNIYPQDKELEEKIEVLTNF
jgi:tetratricopeptide (TPR) repeat protein